MRVWIVEAGERSEGVEIAAEYGGDRRALVFADTEEGYSRAFEAWKVLVVQRIGKNAVYSYPGEIGHMARVEVTAMGGGDDYADYTDVVRLSIYEVIGG